MSTDVTVTKDKAATIYISHPQSSYGVFCYNSMGDLFVQSDWGMYGYSWRAYGDNFKEFLAKTNADYIVGKFSINYRSTTNKKIPPNWEKNLTVLVDEFIKQLKSECENDLTNETSSMMLPGL